MKFYCAILTLLAALLSLDGTLSAAVRRKDDSSAVHIDRWLQQDGGTTAAPTMAPVPAPAAGGGGGGTKTLRPTSSTCNFAAVKAGTCNFTEEYCIRDIVFEPPGMRKFGCSWNKDGDLFQYFLKYNLTNWCFDSVNDSIGQDARSSKRASGGSGYCFSGNMVFEFTTDYSLTSVEITRNLTEPADGIIHEISKVSECDAAAAANADYYFAGSFCKDPCPVKYEINGVACTNTCTPCTNGGAVAAAWDCSNVDASLVRTCDDAKNVDPLELVLIFLRGVTDSPTALPVMAGGGAPHHGDAPTASPVTAGGGAPHHGDAVAFIPTLNTTAAPTKAPTKTSKSAAVAFQAKALVMLCVLATFLLL